MLLRVFKLSLSRQTDVKVTASFTSSPLIIRLAGAAAGATIVFQNYAFGSESVSTYFLRDVKDVCTQPATAGEHWVIKGLNAGNVFVGLGVNGSDGHPASLEFTHEQWSGIQQVLASQQATDNRDFRACVEQITQIVSSTLKAYELSICRNIRNQVNALREKRTRYRDAMDQTVGAQHETFRVLFEENEREVQRMQNDNGDCFK